MCMLSSADHKSSTTTISSSLVKDVAINQGIKKYIADFTESININAGFTNNNYLLYFKIEDK